MGAYIYKEMPNGFKGINCHVADNLDETLFHYYQDPLKVDELIKLGNVSFLGECLEPSELVQNYGFFGQLNSEFTKLSLDEKDRLLSGAKTHTLSYYRDRGEELKYAQECSNFEQLVALMRHYDELLFVMVLKDKQKGYSDDPSDWQWLMVMGLVVCPISPL